MRVKTINTAAQGTAPGPEARPNQAPNRRALPLESRDNTPKRHRGIRALWRDGAGAPYPRSQRALWRKAGAPVPLRPAPQQSATGPRPESPPRILAPTIPLRHVRTSVPHTPGGLGGLGVGVGTELSAACRNLSQYPSSSSRMAPSSGERSLPKVLPNKPRLVPAFFLSWPASSSPLAAALSAESRLRAPTSAATCQSLSMVVGLFLSRCRSLSLSLSLFSESAGGRSLSLSLRWLRPGSANVPVEGNGMLEGILKQSILVPSGRLFVCFDSG